MKLYYNTFIGGLSYSDRMGPQGSYYMGANVIPDNISNYNYLAPETTPSNVDGVSAVADLVVGFVSDVYDSSNNYFVYGIGDEGHVYRIATYSSPDVSAGGTWPYQISASAGPTNVEGHDIINYPVGATNYIFYSWDNTVSGSVGRYNLGSTFRDDYMTVSAASPGYLSAAHPHPMIVGHDGILYIGNGHKVCSFDGQTGTDGTFDSSALDFTPDTEITSFFRYNDYLGITTWQKSNTALLGTYSTVYFWDYVSETYNKSIPIDAIKITSSYVLNGDAILFCSDNYYSSVRRLTNVGSELLARFHYTTNGVDTFALNPPRLNARATYEGKLIFGTDGPYNCVYKYGKNANQSENALTLNYVLPGVNGNIGAIYPAYSQKILMSHTSGTGHYIVKEPSGAGDPYNSNAYWGGLYHDFGQKVKINYVKYYFKPLASGDSAIPYLSLDYGTRVGMVDPRKNIAIAYSTDGPIASKKFMIGKDCYTVRPEISFNDGCVKIQKIEFDYTPVSNT